MRRRIGKKAQQARHNRLFREPIGLDKLYARQQLEKRLLARGWQKGPDGLFDPDMGMREGEKQ
jgi:hypothetical protein